MVGVGGLPLSGQVPRGTNTRIGGFQLLKLLPCGASRLFVIAYDQFPIGKTLLLHGTNSLFKSLAAFVSWNHDGNQRAVLLLDHACFYSEFPDA